MGMVRREAKPEFVWMGRWGQVVELITAEAQREGDVLQWSRGFSTVSSPQNEGAALSLPCCPGWLGAAKCSAIY